MAILFQISEESAIYQEEVRITAIRSQGPGGQHVNKSATAIQLQFDVTASSLPEKTKELIKRCKDYRINSDGIVTIKAQRHRSQEQNRKDAICRLEQLIRKAIRRKKFRIPTKPSKTAIVKKVKQKQQRSSIKKLRSKPIVDE